VRREQARRRAEEEARAKSDYYGHKAEERERQLAEVRRASSWPGSV